MISKDTYVRGQVHNLVWAIAAHHVAKATHTSVEDQVIDQMQG